MIKNLPFLLIAVFPLFAFSPGGQSQRSPAEKNPSVQNTRATKPSEISYFIEPFYDSDIFRLIVVLEFPGDKSGETKITLPEGDGINSIRFLKTLTPNSYIADSDKPEIKIVKHIPNASLRIYYQFEQSVNGKVDPGNYKSAILKRQFFHFTGARFFILPAFPYNLEYRIKLAWSYIPDNWKLADSFGADERNQEIVCTLSNFRNSVFTGGNIKIIPMHLGNDLLYVTLPREGNVSEEHFSAIARDILIEERNFWRDYTQKYYLINLIHLDSGDETSMTGKNYYSLFVSRQREIDFNFEKRIARDLFQTWFGERIKFADPERLLYWFKEGFAEYYSTLFLLRAKLISLDKYADDYNQVLDLYCTSPARNEKNEALLTDDENDKYITQLPYQRGIIFAHNLNFTIRHNTNYKKSLDDLMRDLGERCKNESLIISGGSLNALIRFYAGDEMLSEMMRTLNSGSPIKTTPDALGPCFRMEIDSRKKFIFFGEQYDVPFYRIKEENGAEAKDCLTWFGVD